MRTRISKVFQEKITKNVRGSNISWLALWGRLHKSNQTSKEHTEKEREYLRIWFNSTAIKDCVSAGGRVTCASSGTCDTFGILPTYHTVLSVLLVILVHVMVDYLISRGYSGSLCSGKPGGQLLLLLLLVPIEVLRLIVPLEELVVNSPFCLLWPECPGDPSSTIILDVTLSSARLFACLALFLGK